MLSDPTTCSSRSLQFRVEYRLMQAIGAHPIYRFDTFTLDPIRHSLHRDPEVILLPESAMSVLEALVSRAPETVDKTTLMDVAWPNIAVIPDNLVQAIHTIRTALGGNARQPRFVQTVHRRGYRFVVWEQERDDTPSYRDIHGRAVLRSVFFDGFESGDM